MRRHGVTDARLVIGQRMKEHSATSLTTLRNIRHEAIGEYERIDIVKLGPSLPNPSREHLAGQVMSVRRPKPHEIKHFNTIPEPKGVRYELYIVRDRCPVRGVSSGSRCPICREVHEQAAL